MRNDAGIYRAGFGLRLDRDSDGGFTVSRRRGGPGFCGVHVRWDTPALLMIEGASPQVLPMAREHALVINFRDGPDRPECVRLAGPDGTRPTHFHVKPFRTRKAAMEAMRQTRTCVGHDPRWLGTLRTPFGLPFNRTARHLNAIWALARARPVQAMTGTSPLVSLVVPVLNARPEWLDDLLGSFDAQDRGLAELVLSDDGSSDPATTGWFTRNADVPGIVIVRHDAQRGIAAATNAGISAARGNWIGLVDHDDLLAPHALRLIAETLRNHPATTFLYTDEALVTEGRGARGVFHKPAFDPVLLTGVNVVNHLALYQRERLVSLGGLREGFEGSQDYELVLRYCRGLAAQEIIHLPYPAYIWREVAQSLSRRKQDKATDAARRAIAEHAGADGIASVDASPLRASLHKVRFVSPPGGWPRVSVVIPNKDKPALLATVLGGLRQQTDYPDLEIIVVDNASTDPATLDQYRRLRDGPDAIRVVSYPYPFNFSAMVNAGAAIATGEQILLLNNDVEVDHGNWLHELVSCMAYPGVGIVGAKLLYPNRRIQHAGVIMGLGGYAGHWFSRAKEGTAGPMARLCVRNSLSAVTGACMLVSRRCWHETGGFDEDSFAVAYNDIDFCARARDVGFGVVWTPFARLIHHESASRGSDDTNRNRVRFEQEKAALLQRHATDRVEDPAFSPWWTRAFSHPRLARRHRLPKPRHFLGLDR